jgi:(p)ppGpp synthase/HD superfamily hydrolase
VSTFNLERYLAALHFAARRHADQKMPAGPDGQAPPYVVHVVSVTAEVIAVLPTLSGSIDADLAVACALLHDTVEDTAESHADKLGLADEIEHAFGRGVRDGVWALSKFKTLPDGTEVDKPAQIADSLRRICEQPHAVWAVKLADRITNLAPPPSKWDRAKCERYQAEAQQIRDTLGAGCPPLADRLRARIAAYPASWNR